MSELKKLETKSDRPKKKKVEKGKKKKKEKSKEQQKKEMVIGIILILIATFGVYGFFAILRFSMNTETPLVVVTSGSMETYISRGDLLVIKDVPAADIKNGTIAGKEGDVILYDSHGVWSSPISEPIVHRVVGKYIDNKTGKYMFITKGDANADTDPPDWAGIIEIHVPEDKILGVVVGIIPAVGHVKIFLEDNSLTVPLIVILGGMLVFSIIWDIAHPEEDDDEEEEMKKEKEKIIEVEDAKKPEVDMGL
jgi:signal peptidase I